MKELTRQCTTIDIYSEDGSSSVDHQGLLLLFNNNLFDENESMDRKRNEDNSNKREERDYRRKMCLCTEQDRSSVVVRQKRTFEGKSPSQTLSIHEENVESVSLFAIGLGDQTTTIDQHRTFFQLIFFHPFRHFTFLRSSRWCSSFLRFLHFVFDRRLRLSQD